MSVLPEVFYDSLEDWHEYTQTFFFFFACVFRQQNPDGDEICAIATFWGYLSDANSLS